MRILVTKTGDDLIKELTDELNETMKIKKIADNIEKARRINQNRYKKSNTNSKSPKSSNVSLNKHTKSRNLLSETIKKSARKIENENKLEIDSGELQNSKQIFIKQKRLHIPKNVTEKYNSDSRTGFILPDLTISKTVENENNYTNHFAMTKNKTSYNFNTTGVPEFKNKYSFKEILNDTAYKSLKKKLIKEKKIIDGLSRVDEGNFRTVYGQMDKAQRLESMLDCKINSNKVTLIKYINQKKDISDVFLKKIKESSEEKINRANKICQIVFHNKDKYELINDRIKETIENRANIGKAEYKIGLESMGSNLKEYSNIISEYSNNKDKRGRYKEIHNDVINKYWKKFNVEKLMYKTRSKSILKKLDSCLNLSKTQGSFDF